MGRNVISNLFEYTEEAIATYGLWAELLDRARPDFQMMPPWVRTARPDSGSNCLPIRVGSSGAGRWTGDHITTRL